MYDLCNWDGAAAGLDFTSRGEGRVSPADAATMEVLPRGLRGGPEATARLLPAAPQHEQDVEAKSIAGTPVLLLETLIAGTGYFHIGAIRDQLQDGMFLRLYRILDNEYEPFAIHVLTLGGRKLGFVPRPQNQILAAMMDAGENFYAKLVVTGLSGDKLAQQIYWQRRN